MRIKGSVAEDALSAVRALHAASEMLLDAVAERYGINRNDLRCLEILERDGPLSAHQLATASGLSPAAVTKVLDRLEATRYVIRSPSPTDRRVVMASVSPHRVEWRRAIWRPLMAETRRVFGALSDAELRSLTTTLRRLAEVNRSQAHKLSHARNPSGDSP